jgi:hypothetical protein
MKRKYAKNSWCRKCGAEWRMIRRIGKPDATACCCWECKADIKDARTTKLPKRKIKERRKKWQENMDINDVPCWERHPLPSPSEIRGDHFV